MKITFFSCLSAIFWSDLILLTIHMIRKKLLLSSATEALLLLTAYILCLLRLIFPIDFLFTKAIPFRGLYASICDVIVLQKTFTILPFSFSWWDIFLSIWGIGMFINLFCFLMQYRRYMKRIALFDLYAPERVYKLLPRLYAHLDKSIPCTIYCSAFIHVPSGIGLFRKCILLPDIDYDDEELFFILLHELEHFANGHLFFKFVYQLIACIFWWNPVLLLFQDDFSHLLEIRCDAAVTKHFHPDDTLGYMNTIVNVIRNIHVPKNAKNRSASSVFLVERASEASEKERFHILQSQYKIRKMPSSIYIMTFITTMFFLLSYVIIPVPSYEAPIEEIEQDGALYIDPAKSWITRKEENYFFVTDGNVIPISIYTAESLIRDGFQFN